MASEYQLYEAFVPSGTEREDISRGLFRGDPVAIRAWVCERADYCYFTQDQVRLQPRLVQLVEPEDVELLRRAKADEKEAIARRRETAR